MNTTFKVLSLQNTIQLKTMVFNSYSSKNSSHSSLQQLICKSKVGDGVVQNVGPINLTQYLKADYAHTAIQTANALQTSRNCCCPERVYCPQSQPCTDLDHMQTAIQHSSLSQKRFSEIYAVQPFKAMVQTDSQSTLVALLKGYSVYKTSSKIFLMYFYTCASC